MALNLKPDKPHFFDQTPDSLADLFVQWGLKKFRAKQVMQWVYEKQVGDPQQMTNLSQGDRDLLSQNMVFVDGAVLVHQRATDGTQKLLIDWSLSQADVEAACPDTGAALHVLNNPIGDTRAQTETVMIPAQSRESGKARRTACISSQVGCPVGCKFCASGLGGLDGNLTAGRIVQQAWLLGRLPEVGRISNIVFMGMGEPMTNFKAVCQAIQTLSADWGMGIGARKITVSTVGVPSQMKRLAELGIPVTLALSLHAPNDTIRRQIIPWAEFVSIDQLEDACAHYFQKTGREVTLEYILLGGINDQVTHAQELARRARSMRANINLIRYNEVSGLPWKRPQDDDVLAFQETLQQRGINTHIRASRGRDIAAACGQLRHENKVD